MLADDLRRYMEGRAVLARPQTLAYTVNRFVKRNRAGVGIAFVAALLLLGTLAYAGWRQQQAVLAGQRAMRMQTFLYSLFRIANSHYTGKPAATVPEFLSLGVKLLPRYIQNPADRRQAKLSLAESMFENGAFDDAQRVFAETIASAKAANDVQSEAESEAYAGNIAYQKGEMDKGAALTAHALELSKRNGISTAVRVRCEDYYAVNRENNGFRTDENLQLLEDAARRAKAAALPPHETADVLYSLASDLELRGRLNEAEPIYNESLATYGQDPSELCSRSNVLGDLAYLHEMRGDVQGALPVYKQAYDGFVACSGAESRDALSEQDYYAGALIKLGRAQEAVPLLEKGLPAWRKIIGTGPDLAEVLYFLAAAYDDTGRYTEAEKVATELIQVQTGKVEPTDRRFGASHMVLARALAGEGRYREALPHAQIADQLLSAKAVSPGAKAMMAQAHAVLLDIQSKQHD
jgi:serine/threonine-protein kinase